MEPQIHNRFKFKSNSQLSEMFPYQVGRRRKVFNVSLPFVFIFTEKPRAISVTGFKMQNYKTITVKLSYGWKG